MPEPSKNFYTIQEAIEWIAFRKESTEVTAEYATGHSADLDKAQQTLTQAITMRKVRVFGQVDGKSRYSEMELFLRPELGNHLEYPVEITLFSSQTFISPEDNSILIDDILYRNIQILTDILRKQFPPFTPQVFEEFKGYTTPYIEIMLETIREERLSAENQSKAEALTDIIANKMAKRGLNKSEKLATAMATLIRMPESQKGRNQMG